MIQTESQLQAHFSRPFDDFASAVLRQPLAEGSVVISTFPKCGTTWAGQIAHGIRSNGDVSFNNLGDVMPWLEMGHVFGHDVAREQGFEPALYKSHMELSQLPAGTRIINIIRDPGDVLLSYYNFWSNTVFDPTKISIEMLANRIFFSDHSDGPLNMFRLNYFQHIVDFHELDYGGPVLFLAYEDMKLNLPAAARRIARFMGVELSKTRERLVVEQATFDFMSRHRAKFSERVPTPPDADESAPPVRLEMVRTGRVGDANTNLSDELKVALEEGWRNVVTPQLGYRNYAELRAAISLST